MKQTIRLTESELRNIIRESVKKCLYESKYMDDGDLEAQYDKNPDAMWTYGASVNPAFVDGLRPNQVRKAGSGNKRADNQASWDYFDAVSNGADMRMKGELKRAYDDRFPRYQSAWEKGAYLDSRKFPHKDLDDRFNGYLDDMKDDFDKQWQDTKEKEKYERQADSRPLHRKGSLNRAMDDWHGKN